MAMFTTKTMALMRSCILWSFAFFLIKNPKLITDHHWVLLISKAMMIPQVVIHPDNPLVGILGLVLALQGFADIPVLFGDYYIEYFENTLLVRLCAYFFICAYGYLVYTPYLTNSLVFCYGFLEVVINFVMFANLREERNEKLKGIIRERQFRQEQDLDQQDEDGQEVENIIN